MKEVSFGNEILRLEELAFNSSEMPMPRWVFFDCAIVPGFVSGFAIETQALPLNIKKKLPLSFDYPWTPLSLFIMIPTMSSRGEWVAHNLCSVNYFLSSSERYYGLGFLSKAFGLWYANVETCCGFTQWGNPAIRLHSYYGSFEILTAYTPMHSHQRTLTYKAQVLSKIWPQFFSKKRDFAQDLKECGRLVDPKDDKSLIQLQDSLEKGQGPYFLNPQEISTKNLNEPLKLYKKS